MDVESWLRLNKNKMGSTFESAFVRNVLAHVKDIDWGSIQAQYHFTDLDKGNRYCDFVIKEGTVRIAIEIDGYSKRNTGGMSHNEFIDWQRRQAALTAQGWYVLRFANRDVMQYPQQCKRYIELLLQEQRSKSQHQAKLENDLRQMHAELLAAQGKKLKENTNVTAIQLQSLQQDINVLTQQLAAAKQAHPLSDEDKLEKKKLILDLESENQVLRAAASESEKQKKQLELKAEAMQQQGQQLGQENKSMRTTVWAFTTIICLLIISAVYLYTHGFKSLPLTMQAEAEPKNAFCDGAVAWSQAKNHIGQQIKVKDIILEYRYMPQINGQPTWMSMGAKYPNSHRLALIVWGANREALGTVLTNNLVGNQVCVTGIVSVYDHTPQIIISHVQQLLLE